MRRRNFIAGICAVLSPRLAWTQQPSKLPRVGVLATTPRSETDSWQLFLAKGLKHPAVLARGEAGAALE
jgi:hypothetical protein